MALATTKMSSKGQVVIPEEIRKRMNLKEGVRFIVINHGDNLFFKPIPEPSPAEFRETLAQIRAEVKKAGIKKSDLAAAIKYVRRNRK